MLSVVISAFNEEQNIKDCIESVKNLADEIIVVDNSSNDKTSEVAKKLGAKVFIQENDVRKIDLQKNYGFEKAREEWTLSLDADERITPKLADEIRGIINSGTSVNGYYIPRKNIIFGKWIKNSIWWPDYQLRLFRRGKGKFTKASVHEPIEVKGETRHFEEPMIHHNYVSVSQFVNKMNNIYTEVEAEVLIKSGKKIHVSDSIKMPASDFLKTFFLQKGYKDGLHGLVLSVLQSFYMFLVFAKIWEKQGFREKSESEVLKVVENGFWQYSRELKFWLFNSLMHEAVNPLKKAVYFIGKKLS